MTTELIELLRGGNHSLVVACGNEVRTFDGRGVSDLLRLLEEKSALLPGASVADKVVGKAAAALMALGKVREVYAEVISQPAFDLLTANGIQASYGALVPHIINRAGTGLCPLETRCMDCAPPSDCLVRIKEFVAEMKSKAK